VVPNLSLWQCDMCGWAEFTALGYTGPLDGAEVKLTVDSSAWRVCGGCMATLLARKGMFELTGDMKRPVKLSKEWPPKREQDEHPERSS
jgi:hypothetical protein